MRHARSDYNRIQDPAVSDPSLLSEGSTPIGEDEPVFLIRGSDVAGPFALFAWADEMQRRGGDPATAAAVRQFARDMEWWADINGCKVPDTPAECLKGQ